MEYQRSKIPLIKITLSFPNPIRVNVAIAVAESTVVLLLLNSKARAFPISTTPFTIASAVSSINTVVKSS